MGNAPSHQGGTPPHADDPRSSASAPPAPLSKDKDKDVPAAPSSPAPPQTPLLMPYGGHLSPQNPHALGLPQAHDYSKTIVTALILNQQLAPFYRGLDDFEEDWSELDTAHALAETREKDFAEQVQNSATSRLRDEREVVARGRRLDHEAERAERQRREDKAYLGALECPICFLYYPPNINTSRCCQQPLCTECFVQIKRADATSTHLESDSACCPFCVETDFGVIYERPTAALPTPSGILSPALDAGPGPASALATSPDAGTSAFSALSLSEEPMSPGVSDFAATFREEGKRRKSVSSKAKEVVTIDAIRPDWETKLNAVKAQAARRAARRIVMRQVGDRLIPIGYTSSRATGQADFSMSIPPEEAGGSRRSRRTREREREMEEMMIMEAMRLSLLDHEEHQRKSAAESKKPGEPSSGLAATSSDNGSGNGNGSGDGKGTGTSSPTPSTSSRRSSRAHDTLAGWRQSESGGRAAKLLSKITVNRSRANSKSSVHFAPSPTTLGAAGALTPGSSASGTRARSSSSPSPAPGMHPEHQPSPLSANVTTRRSLDVPGGSRSAAAALQAALGPGQPAIAELPTPAADTDMEVSPLARELAAASGDPDTEPAFCGAPLVESPSVAVFAPAEPAPSSFIGAQPFESPLTELAPAPVVDAPPGEDLLHFDTNSTGSVSPNIDSAPRSPSLGSDVTPAANPSRRTAELPLTSPPISALGAGSASLPGGETASPSSPPADSLLSYPLHQASSTAPTSFDPSPVLPSPSAPIPAPVVPPNEILEAAPPIPAKNIPTIAVDSPAKASPFKPPIPRRADTSTSLVSVDAASFVSHSSLGTHGGDHDDEIVRRPSGPLASHADDDD